MARRARQLKEPKRKAVNVRICLREHGGKVTEPWVILERLIKSVRNDLADVPIGIVWHKGWRPNADGLVKQGAVKKLSESERQRTGIDWDIQLSEPVWKALDDAGKERLISHELEHIQVRNDADGHPMLDDKNRIVTRLKQHDVGEFLSVIQRYGLPKVLTEMDIKEADMPLLKLQDGVAGPPASPPIDDVQGAIVHKVTRLAKPLKAVAEFDLYKDGEGRDRARACVIIDKGAASEASFQDSNGAGTPQEALSGLLAMIQDWLGEQEGYKMAGALESRICDFVKAWSKELPSE